MRAHSHGWAAGVVLLGVCSLLIAACGGTKTAASKAACQTVTMGTAAPAAGAVGFWPYSNADLANTRVAPGSTISSANVSRLEQAWTFKLTGTGGGGVAGSGSLAANPIVEDGVVYLQDLDSNVYALALASGKLEWEYQCNAPERSGPGPNGVAVADGRVYGETPTSAFALSAATGKPIWVNTPRPQQRRGDVRDPAAGGRRPRVSRQPVRDRTRRRCADRAERVNRGAAVEVQHGVGPEPGVQSLGLGSGGAWETPLVSGDGSVTFGIGNPYQTVGLGDGAPCRAALHRQRREPRRGDRKAALVLPGRAQRLQGLRHAGLADLGERHGVPSSSAPARWATSTR